MWKDIGGKPNGPIDYEKPPLAMAGWSGAVDGAEIEFDVELFFEQIGASLCITEVFGNVAASIDFERNGSALERSAHVLNALAMRVIEAFGNTNEGGKTAGDAFVVIV
jgi:hypothetical protein